MSQASRAENAGLLQGAEHPHSPVLLCWPPPQFHSAAPGSHQATQQLTQEQSSTAQQCTCENRNAEYPCQEVPPVGSAHLEIWLNKQTTPAETNKPTPLALSFIIKIQTHGLTLY